MASPNGKLCPELEAKLLDGINDRPHGRRACDFFSTVKEAAAFFVVAAKDGRSPAFEPHIASDRYRVTFDVKDAVIDECVRRHYQDQVDWFLMGRDGPRPILPSEILFNDKEPT